MKVTIDTSKSTLSTDEHDQPLELYSPEAFAVVSRIFVKVGWALKYSYGFTWMGRPIIQLPEDMVRIQETIYRLKPDVVIETGVAHGGSLIFYAGLMKAMGRGRVIGVDVKIKEENRRSIESHEMASLIQLVEGDSISSQTVGRVRSMVREGERVLVILDSNHSKSHVANELEAYSPLVTPGSYIVATDGIMEDLSDVPGGVPGWRDDNPSAAAREFARRRPDEWVLEKPPFLMNEALSSQQITHWPDAYLRRVI